jgi:hypothetical protein
VGSLGEEEDENNVLLVGKMARKHKVFIFEGDMLPTYFKGKLLEIIKFSHERLNKATINFHFTQSPW